MSELVSFYLRHHEFEFINVDDLLATLNVGDTIPSHQIDVHDNRIVVIEPTNERKEALITTLRIHMSYDRPDDLPDIAYALELKCNLSRPLGGTETLKILLYFNDQYEYFGYDLANAWQNTVLEFFSLEARIFEDGISTILN